MAKNHTQKNKNSGKTGNDKSKTVFSSNTKATAPYNFVSLPEKILPSPIKDVESYKEQVASPENLSGEIALDIESLTPLFIGGKGEKSFAPVNEKSPIIPGSSLRGMFKNIFKIVTCGAFRGATDSQKKGEDFNDEHIYFRCLMKNNNVDWDNGYNWSKDLNKLYTDRMTSNQVKNAIPGFLVKTSDGKYYIAPLDEDCYEGKIPITDQKFKNLEKSCVLWEKDKAYIFTGKGGKKKVVRYTEIGDINRDRKKWLELPEDVRLSYEHDRNRRGVNLLDEKDNKGILKRAKVEEMSGKKFPDVETLVPCHFLVEGRKVTAFGHGQCFRIPYKKAIGDVVSKNLRDEKIIDFADAVFGRESFWASRVFFEDAKPVEPVQTLSPDLAHILMQPNPTSYQLYLKQADGQPLIHWDSANAKLRGYKMYWHNNSENDWRANADEDKNFCKKITPLKKGSHFTAKIRFQNLTEVELGALLMIFDLNVAKNQTYNPAYKIGMGKSLGLGSIKVTPKLFVESETAYKEFFDGDFFKNPYREENFAKYLDAFKNYVKAQGMEKIWRETVEELNLILDWDVTQKNGWREKIEAMSGNIQSGKVDKKFENRSPLPTISQVLKC